MLQVVGTHTTHKPLDSVIFSPVQSTHFIPWQLVAALEEKVRMKPAQTEFTGSSPSCDRPL